MHDVHALQIQICCFKVNNNVDTTQHRIRNFPPYVAKYVKDKAIPVTGHEGP
jgi:hypothetical protein